MRKQIINNPNRTQIVRVTNLKSLASIQGKRLDNYSAGLSRVFLEPYSEEIEAVIGAYNKTSSEKTMALRLARNSSRRIQNRRSHQDMVEGIAVMIAKKLGLNVGLTRIIARNHDIGHTFYGHGGEWWLSNVKEEFELGEYTHNSLGPKELIYRHGIYDKIMERIKAYNTDITDGECTRIRRSLWIIFDGMNSHNGELSETEFRPNKEKTNSDFEAELMRCHTEKGFDKKITPATIEECTMRLSDKIAYTPFDMVDGLYEGMIEKLDGEYIRILKELGITDEEIESANVRHEYEEIARRLQVIFTKSAIENSSKSVIAMDIEKSRLMHELRNLNNREIIDLEVLQEDQDIIPPAIRTLMIHYADLIQENVSLDDLRFASTSYGLQKRLMDRYIGSPDEGFVRYITRNKSRNI